ncbi:MAG TPA: glycosyltransferase family 2 protein [Chitinispirillaceae bacterium]|nr:glycosyltransferase family 2 protein [Fibrobacter sp.]HLV33057.1 glycosyltransferase family 2 protein [Chitinispirillaceae bacterium]
MKLVIQIPCWNEEEMVARMVRSIPSRINGVDETEIIVVDDGSTDNTVEMARKAGVSKVICLPRHKGLASAFIRGIEEAFDRGADILVNTDADMQYDSESIADLIRPVIENRADMVIGDRLCARPRPFGPLKMIFQRLGTAVVRFFSGTYVTDAASGFRAFSRAAIKELVIHDKFSYTMESIFLAGAKQLRIVNVPVKTNAVTRKSRLFKTLWQYICRSAETIIRIYLMYHPLRFFVSIGILFLTGAFALGLRFLLFYFQGDGGGHVQSLILLVVFSIIGVQSIIVGLVADVVSANRRLLEEIRIRQMEIKK